jgi:outer membrane protein TolC
MNLFKKSVAVVLAIAAPASAERQPIPVTSEYISRLVSEAGSRHPKIVAAQARASAAAESVRAVRLWQDPELGLGLRAAPREMRRDDGDIRVGYDQQLPRRGLYQAEAGRSAAEQRVKEAEVGMSANELAMAIGQATVELALADEMLGLQEQEIRWLETIVVTARERLKNPDATSGEPLRLESELAVRIQKRDSAQRQRVQLARTLNLLLLRNENAAWPALRLPEIATARMSAPALRAEMEARNPRLAALRHQIEASQAESDAAREKTKPVFSVGAETNVYSGSGDFREGMVTAKMTLPWFNRAAYRADIEQADRLRSAAESDLAAEVRDLYTRLTGFITDVENNGRLSLAYQTEVLPRSLKAAETLQSAWAVSRATLLEVLDSRRALLDIQLEQKRAAAAGQAALQNLWVLTGRFAKTGGTK